MGNSSPNRKERKKVCNECPTKCESYLETGRYAYSPKKSHKIPYENRAHLSILYQFCTHYDPIKKLGNELGLEEFL